VALIGLNVCVFVGHHNAKTMSVCMFLQSHLLHSNSVYTDIDREAKVSRNEYDGSDESNSEEWDSSPKESDGTGEEGDDCESGNEVVSSGEKHVQSDSDCEEVQPPSKRSTPASPCATLSDHDSDCEVVQPPKKRSATRTTPRLTPLVDRDSDCEEVQPPKKRSALLTSPPPSPAKTTRAVTSPTDSDNSDEESPPLKEKHAANDHKHPPMPHVARLKPACERKSRPKLAPPPAVITLAPVAPVVQGNEPDSDWVEFLSTCDEFLSMYLTTLPFAAHLFITHKIQLHNVFICLLVVDFPEDDNKTCQDEQPTCPAPVVPTSVVPAPVVPATVLPTPVVPATVVPAPVVPATVVPAPVVPAPVVPALVVPTTVVRLTSLKLAHHTPVARDTTVVQLACRSLPPIGSTVHPHMSTSKEDVMVAKPIQRFRNSVDDDVDMSNIVPTDKGITAAGYHLRATSQRMRLRRGNGGKITYKVNVDPYWTSSIEDVKKKMAIAKAKADGTYVNPHSLPPKYLPNGIPIPGYFTDEEVLIMANRPHRSIAEMLKEEQEAKAQEIAEGRGLLYRPNHYQRYI
jgi:hypothetical protein